jgi:hypothetical protein
MKFIHSRCNCLLASLSIFLLVIGIVYFICVRIFLYIMKLNRKLANWVDDQIHDHQFLKVPEFDESNQKNLFNHKVLAYLNSLDNTNWKKPKDIDEQTIEDTFMGANVYWTNRVDRDKRKIFLLKVKVKDKRKMLWVYIQHIYNAASEEVVYSPPLCNFNSFKTLADNCLGLKDHRLFPQVEEIFKTGSTMSPAR